MTANPDTASAPDFDELLSADDLLRKHAHIHLRELLELHWRAARDSADEDGRFAISFRVAVSDGAPARVKVTSRIATTVTDEIESTVNDPAQAELL